MAIVPVARVVGDNVNQDGKNRGSLAFYVKAEGSIEQEVGRVAFERSNGLWKDKSWDEALVEVKTRITSSIKTMHELTEFAGKLL